MDSTSSPFSFRAHLRIAALALIALAGCDRAPLARPPAGPAVRAIGAALPLAFEANAGQVDPAVRFLARARGATVYLTDSEVVLQLPGSVVRMRLLGANPEPAITGDGALPGRSHYLIGNDPAAWHTDVSTFRRVVVRGVYPGIDLVVRGDGGRLEYDFAIAPGADPDAIRLAVDGADRLAVDDRGDLQIAAGPDVLVQRAPRVEATRNGERRAVPGRMIVEGARTLRFEVAARDPGDALLIDPVIETASYLGGSAEDQAYGAGVDAAGNLYVATQTTSANFPTTAGVLDTTLNGNYDAAVTKLDPTGSTVLWSTFVGGASKDAVTNLAVDPGGHAYIVGSTGSRDLPMVNAAQPTAAQIPDAWVAKLDPSGAAIVFSTYLGGSGADAAWGIDPDPSGNVCVAGETNGPGFPTVNAAQATLTGLTDAFVARFDPNGALLYSTYWGGTKEDLARDVAAAPDGSCIAVGQTVSTDFPVVSALQPSPAGKIDSFVAKLSPTGVVQFATYLGGTQSETARGVVTDASGSIYVTGGTYSPDFPVTADAVQPANAGDRDAYVAKFSPDGHRLVYATYLGGSGTENLFDFGVPIGGAIAVDRAGSMYLTGVTTSIDFPTVDAFQPASGGGADAFVAKLTPDGHHVVYASYLGGADIDHARGIAVDAGGNVLVAGETTSQDFPVVAALQPQHGGGLTDGFLAKITLGPGVLDCGVTMSAASYTNGQTATASQIHVANPTVGPLPARLRLLLTAPAQPAAVVLDAGADGSLYLPGGLDAHLGPAPLFGVQPGLARGTWSFGCELADPVTGAVLASGAAAFDLQ